MPASTPNRDAVQANLRGLRKMPFTCYSYPAMCFSYPDDVPPGAGNRDAAQRALPGVRRMPFGSCFRY